MTDVTDHRFRVGQSVTIRRSPLSSAAGQYVILRLMPSEGQAVCYRIKGNHEIHDRIVAEYELDPPVS